MVADVQRKVALAQYMVKIDGAQAAPELEAAIEEVVVDERLHVPTMIELRLYNVVDPIAQTYWSDDARIQEGKEIEVVVYDEKNNPFSLGSGVVTSIEADIGDQMPLLTVRAYDRSFKLHRGRKTKTFLKQTDSEIAQQIASGCGLSADVQGTSQQHEFVLQYNETDYAFLQRRAARIGYEVRCDGRKLIFKKLAAQSSGVTLEYGKNLLRFRPQLTLAEQHDKVMVHGWDPKEKQAIVGTATTGATATRTGVTKTGGANAKSVWGSTSERHVVDLPVATQGEATALAQALLDEAVGDYVRAEGETFAEPKLRVGSVVEVKKVGTRFSGTYHVTAVTHRLTKDRGHLVEFVASTRRPTTLAGLVESIDEPQVPDGVAVGIVTNNKDPENKGRVKLKYPWLKTGDTDWESDWVRIASPMGGPNRGWLILPEINDEVLVAFEHGDTRYPYILGGLWNGKDEIPVGTKGKDQIVGGDGKVNLRYWRSRSGHLFEFDDSQGEEKISIIDKTGDNFIKITSKDGKLEVEMKGDIQVTSKTGKLSVKANKDVAIESETGKVSIKANKDVAIESATASASLKAQQNVAIDSSAGKTAINAGTNFEASSKAQMKLAATGPAEMTSNATLSIKGTGPTTVQSSATLDLKSSAVTTVDGSAMLNVKSSGILNIQGSLVKIN